MLHFLKKVQFFLLVLGGTSAIVTARDNVLSQEFIVFGE